MSAGTVRCSRCGRRLRSLDGWNVEYRGSKVVGYLCPGCQTAEENAEAAINEATLDYAVDAFGRPLARPKANGR